MAKTPEKVHTAIESSAWVERELKKRSRSLAYATPDEHRAIITKKTGGKSKVTVRFSSIDGLWHIDLDDPNRNHALRNITISVTLPKTRDDRCRVLFAIATEYLMN
jgi:hypothetical protein